eukprot:CAMPEP_0182881618 /NCGR_PEP_ID=MMETSP0034_2-20130328/17285_1 /TAXON_ID=156128 /ORGANISM="Nephroselmis pyriformis, Strain CCMP717" /LENGTH=107 /DNA_ID=CAMNT_0025014657 /DNA_START=109 /DNA_END=428 /DNA_ORIENTATION=-
MSSTGRSHYSSPTREAIDWRTSMESIVAATDYNLRKAFGNNRKEFESSMYSTKMSLEDIERHLKRPDPVVPELAAMPHSDMASVISDRLAALEVAVKHLDISKGGSL